MERFQLNYNQIIGLMTYSLGIIVQSLIGNSIGMLITLLGSMVFLISSKFKVGTILSLLTLAVGFMFKLLHYPYGNEIMLLGMQAFLLSVFFNYLYKTYKLDIILIYVSFVIFIIGIYFKISHLKHAMELIAIGGSAITVSYALRFIKKTPKHFEDYNKMLLVCFWALSTIFNMFHLTYSNLFLSIFMVLLWTWLVTSMIRELRIK